MSRQVYTVKIAGPAGMGVKSAGQILAEVLVNLGFHLFDYTEYPSLVRGGHNTYQISFSTSPVYFIHRTVDLFISLAPNHWQIHQNELAENAVIISPPDFPLNDLAGKVGNLVTANTVCLGAAATILGLNPMSFKDIIKAHFGKYAEINWTAFQIGFDFAVRNFNQSKIKVKMPDKSVKLSHNYNDGNEAAGWGFLKAGGDFYTAYPMTPASGILHFLAAHQGDYHLQVVHPEDEIAAINLAAGAAYAGARAATGTSGGGFALMTEAVSLLGMAGIGAVVYLISRPGPATGLPTWTSQGDLLFAIHAGHGEFPKIVLSPGSQQESFELSRLAINLAVKHQLPVIFLSDKMLGESAADTTDLSAEKTIMTPLPRILPGTKGQEYLVNSYEHDDQGFSTEDAEVTKKMVEKRLAKIKNVLPDLPSSTTLRSVRGSTKLIITWGSVTGAVREADLEDYDILPIKTLWPIDPQLETVINSYQSVVVVENNASSQLTTLLKSQFNFKPDRIITKYDGRPFFPEEIYERCK